MRETDYIISEFSANGLEINEYQAEQFYKYYSMLVEKNKVVNLTAITEFNDVVIKHFIDSAILVKYLNNDSGSKMTGTGKIIDIGTGAGFPGIPIKIMCPELEMTLVDSLNKRIIFLDEVINTLELKNIRTIHSRAEDLARKPEHREQYTMAVSRAVSNLTTLVEYVLPYVKVGGKFYSYKGSKAQEETDEAKAAIKILGGSIRNKIDINISGTDYDRTIIEIEKVSSTPGKYPRSGNKPSTNPLH
ncbi:MAG: 16S rRNA (guanine(527)-N(7))-methyltransferase RsmG [Lachnospiraceae bacterium]|nr:16S rRNA (guanine(527)-N(7))-methyltransferase RsmG [Lachnospiraceae bacterium]